MLKVFYRYLKNKTTSRKLPQEADNLKYRVENLQSTVNKIAADLSEALKNMADQSFDIHIDKIEIDKVNLEQLVFNIDGIGVRTLSGSLSIGINHGGRVIRVPQLPPPVKTNKNPPKHNPLPAEHPQINIQYKGR